MNEEKFKVWTTNFCNIGLGICWDQWFPETTRILVLKGADIVMYPTAIGSEANNPGHRTLNCWKKAILGQSSSNIVPIIIANRYAKENGQVFYGHSFISDYLGNILTEAYDTKNAVILASLNLKKLEIYRKSFGFFSDRRPKLYKLLSFLKSV